MATYGKKKKSILPSFSILRDSSSSSGSKRDKAKKRVSTIHPTLTLAKDSIPSHHDDTIDEMASILLEDTNLDQAESEHGGRLGQVTAAKMTPGFSDPRVPRRKTLPQLPQLVSNGEDAWAAKTSSAVTVVGSSNEVLFSDDVVAPENSTSNFSKSLKHTRKGSAPKIPRRSSKRKSLRPKEVSKQQSVLTYEHPTTPSDVKNVQISSADLPQIPQARPRTGNAGIDVARSIEAMLAAQEALKGPSDSGALRDTVKKHRVKDNRVLTRVKTAINSRLQVRSARKTYDPAGDDLLLDSSVSELRTPDNDFPTDALTSVERRMNEGDNFKKPKINSLTGHGNVRRKPLVEDGKSLRSLKSVSDDPFSESPSSRGITRTPTSFENRLRDDMSIDRTAEIIPDLPSRAYSLKDELTKPKQAKQHSVIDDSEFDALFSSSPLAQSTPRIRLEPTFEKDGKATLKNVPADSRSLFDPDNSSFVEHSDMETEIPSFSKASSRQLVDPVKRKSSLAGDSSFGQESQTPKRMKKHPSPSKAELESLEKALRQFSTTFDTMDNVNGDIPNGFNELLPPAALATKDANVNLAEPTKRREKGKGFGMFLKPELSRTTVSVPDTQKRGKAQKLDMIPKSAGVAVNRIRLEARDERRLSTRMDMDSSVMDIDELQWDQTALLGKA